MKRLCNVIAIVCILWFSFCNTIDYSKAFVANIHRDSLPISISVSSASNNYIDLIVMASELTESAIFCEYTSFTNVVKTQYSIYASTSAFEKIILYPGSNRPLSFGKGEAVSNSKIGENTALLHYTDLLYDITIQNISEVLSAHNSDEYATTFYVASQDLQKFTSYLNELGLAVTYITDSAATSYKNNTWDSFQWYCLFFMAVCTLFHCFRKSKSIVVKKLGGYNLSDIISTEFRSSITISSIGVFLALFVETFLFELRDNCGGDYFLFSINNYVLLLAFMLLCIIVPGCYSVFERRASDIKHIKFPKLMQVISTLIKIITCILVLNSTSNTLSVATTLRNLNVAHDTIQPLADSYSLQFNAASTSIDLNIGDVEAKCSVLYEILEENDNVNCIFINASNYIDATENTIYNIYINAEYFNYSCIFETDNIRITADSIDGTMIFIPDDLYSEELVAEYMYSFHKVVEFGEITIKPYKSGQRLPTYSPGSGLALGGYAHNPILVVAEPSCYSGAMLSAFSSANILLDIKDESSVSILWDAISEADLNIFVSNLQTLDSTYKDAVQATKVLFIEQCLSNLIYVLMYLFTVTFHSTVYFSINSKKIAIKKVAGYNNLDVNLVELCIKLVLFFSLFLYSKYQHVDYRVLIVMIAYDIVQFYFSNLQFSERKMSNTIKGEDYLP